jgi:hypothetical protein
MLHSNNPDCIGVNTCTLESGVEGRSAQLRHQYEKPQHADHWQTDLIPPPLAYGVIWRAEFTKRRPSLIVSR